MTNQERGPGKCVGQGNSAKVEDDAIDISKYETCTVTNQQRQQKHVQTEIQNSAVVDGAYIDIIDIPEEK